jgi:TRAP-type C4-dicarboxylate transport system permease small subunit
MAGDGADGCSCFGFLVWYGWKLAYDEYRSRCCRTARQSELVVHGLLPLLSAVVVLRAIGRFIRLSRGQDG